MDDQQIHQALAAVWAVVGDANRYFAASAPWELKKTDPRRMETVLYVTAELLRIVGILVQPAMPHASARLLDLLALPSDQRDFARLAAGKRLMSGVVLPEPQVVFPRVAAGGD
jgi:methionyl-tRNA synthetase